MTVIRVLQRIVSNLEAGQGRLTTRDMGAKFYRD